MNKNSHAGARAGHTLNGLDRREAKENDEYRQSVKLLLETTKNLNKKLKLIHNAYKNPFSIENDIHNASVIIRRIEQTFKKE